MKPKKKRNSRSKVKRSLSLKKLQKSSPLLSDLTPRTLKEAKKNSGKKVYVESARIIFYMHQKEDLVAKIKEQIYQDYRKYIKVIAPIIDNDLEESRHGLSIIFSQKTLKKNQEIYDKICARYSFQKVYCNSEKDE